MEPTSADLPAALADADADDVTLNTATAPEDDDPLTLTGDVLTDDELAAEGLEP